MNLPIMIPFHLFSFGFQKASAKWPVKVHQSGRVFFGNKTEAGPLWIKMGPKSLPTPLVEEQDKLARFEQSIMPHMDAAYNLSRWLAGNDSDAQDVVQDAYLR